MTARYRAHRGDVGEIHGDDSVTYVGRTEVLRVVHAFDKRVDDLHLLFTWRGLQHRTVIADTDDNSVGLIGAIEIAPY